MALTRYFNLHLKKHFPAIYSMQKTSGHIAFFCPSGLTMVGIWMKPKLVKFYENFSRYNFEKLIWTLTSEIFVGTHFHAWTWHWNYPGVFITCWWRSLLVATSKYGLLTIRWHIAMRKHLLLYPQGDRSGLRQPKKDKHQH